MSRRRKHCPPSIRFHPKSARRAPDRAELADYAPSGYDRSQTSSNGDMHDRYSQAQSFSLVNLAPHVHAGNAGVWEGSEGAARHLALRDGEIHVLLGRAFIDSMTRRIGRVLATMHL